MICDIPGCGRKTHTKYNKKCSDHVAGGSRKTARQGRAPGSGALRSITEQEWLLIYASQDGKCYLCRHVLYNRYSGTERVKKVQRVAALDHCHVIEREFGTRASIRGLLCLYPCNRILRREMDADWLLRGAEYVAVRPAQKILEPTLSLVPSRTSASPPDPTSPSEET